ncbi:MAG: A/G-specific adenine glycosylase [Treponema sp.]|jgi:A/G-specific adenine glycosylase|nr:A/G-specific adenine glycosylase [Treponema sp.]
MTKGEVSPGEITAFREAVYANYKKEKRIFPWRTNISPWGVLVSEFMLQQTQTERVVECWKRWMDKWPSPKLLHEASREEALRAWGTLGYTRRCFFLKDCARRIIKEHNGKVPDRPKDLEELPGIGPYTARAVPCFAYNIPTVFIETNIRAAVLHFFFKDKDKVTDKELMPILQTALDQKDPRTWYWALMDYGAALKKLVPNPNRRSAHYSRQSPFEGSFRQLRGAVVRALAQGPAETEELQKRSGIESGKDLYQVLEALEKEQIVAESKGIYRIMEGEE